MKIIYLMLLTVLLAVGACIFTPSPTPTPINESPGAYIPVLPVRQGGTGTITWTSGGHLTALSSTSLGFDTSIPAGGVSADSPLIYSTVTGIFSIPVATVTTPGYTASADWMNSLLSGGAVVFASDSPAIDRAIALKMKDVYGARVQIADGTADDVEIQAAFNASPDVTADIGTFNLSNGITIPNNFGGFKGFGNSTIIDASRLAAGAKAFSVADTATTKINMVFENFWLRGGVSTASYGFYLENSVYFSTLRNLYITDFGASAGGGGAIVIQGLGNGNIIENNFIIFSYRAVYLNGVSSTYQANMNTIKGGEFNNNFYGVVISANSQFNHIIDTIIESNSYGAKISGERNTLSNVWFELNPFVQVEFDGTNNVMDGGRILGIATVGLLVSGNGTEIKGLTIADSSVIATGSDILLDFHRIADTVSIITFVGGTHLNNSTISLPVGTYNSLSTISLWTGDILEGKSMTGTIINGGITHQAVVLQDGETDMVVRNLSVKTTPGGGSSFSALQMGDINIQNALISRVGVLGSDSMGMIIRGTGTVIEQSKFISGSIDGSDIYLDADSADVVIRDSTGILSVTDGGTRTKFYNNPGFVTENSGSAVILNGQTSVAFTHGLAITPSINKLRGNALNLSTTEPGEIYFDRLDSSGGFINVRTDPGATNLTVGWSYSNN